MERREGAWITVALMAILALIWGSSFILMKRGLFHENVPVLSSVQLAGARLFIAWAALSPLLFRYAPLLKAHWLPLLGTGLLGNGIPAFLFAWAQTRIDSSLAGMLNSLTPLFTLLMGVLLFRAPIRAVQVAGILLGLMGAVGLVAFGVHDGAPAWSAYALLPVAGTLCYGISGNIVKNKLYMLPPAATAVLALGFVGLPGLAVALYTDVPGVLAHHPHGWSALAHVTVLAVMSSAFSLVLWNALLQRTSAVAASTVTYLMPVVAITWGLLDGEVLTRAQLLMIAVVLAGVYLVGRSEQARGR